MSFFEFPHTRTYDSDLGFIIKWISTAQPSIEELQAWRTEHDQEYEALKTVVDGLVDSLTDIIVPWDSSNEYQIFDIVEYQGTNYIAVQDVPVGAMITDTNYWIPANTIVEQINAISVITSGVRKNIIYTEIQSIEDAETATEDTLVVVNGGDIFLNNYNFPDYVDFLFVNGILSGTGEIHGNIFAGRKQIFDPGIVLTVEKQKTGYPEWFGSGDAGIQACYNIFTETDLDAVDYEINNTLLFNLSHKTVKGKVYNSEYAFDTTQQGSRLICKFNDAPCIIVGTGTSTPGTTQNWLSDFSVACETPDYTNGNCTGIEVHGTRACNLNHILCSNFRNGFNFLYTVLCQAVYCRFICNKSSGSETVIGFRVSDNVESQYITHCDITFQFAGMDNTTGIYVNVPGGINDLWITDNLFSRCYYGIQMIGVAGAALQQDNFIVNNCIDNCVTGIRISQNLKIIISDNWVSVGNHGVTTRAIHLTSHTGSAIISNNYVKSANNATLTSSYGLRLESANNVVAHGNTYENFSNPIHMSNSNMIDIEDQALNNNVNRTTNACIVEGTANSKIALGINGAYTYANGVQVTGTCSYILIDVSRILTAAIATAKLLIAGVAQTNANAYTVLSNNNSFIGAI